VDFSRRKINPHIERSLLSAKNKLVEQRGHGNATLDSIRTVTFGIECPVLLES
jgi:hypothetical protein